MATSKKSSSKKSPIKKTPAKKSPGKVSARGNLRQIDAGWYAMYQGSNEVGQVVVKTVTGGTTEYYFLYQSGTGAGQGPYTQPGPSTCPVTTKLTYSGSLPPGWSTPSKYQSNLYPIAAQLVTANCTVSLTKKK